MGGSVNFALIVLTQDDGVFRHFDGSQWRRGGAVGHMIVGRAGVVHRPQEIIDAVAVEDIGGLAIGVVAKGTAFGLLTAALFIGVVPFFLGAQIPESSVLFGALAAVSGVLLVIGLREAK